MAVARWLADTSVIGRFRLPAFASWEREVQAGLVATCAAIDIEVLYSARSPAEYEQLRGDRRELYERLPMPDEVWDRALDVQRVLAAAGKLRSVGLSDLVIAATAERAGVTLLHYDGDFDRIADITGQPTRWAAPPSTN